MSKETTRAGLLKQLFATHPGVNEVFVTSDDQIFLADHYAHAHARTLEDKEVSPEKRDGASKPAKAPEGQDMTAKTALSYGGEAGIVAPAAPAATEPAALATAEPAATQEPEKPVFSADRVEPGEPSTDPKAEKKELVKRYTELKGNKPAGNATVDQLKAKIAEMEANPKTSKA